jgi:hypothetical protein
MFPIIICNNWQQQTLKDNIRTFPEIPAVALERKIHFISMMVDKDRYKAVVTVPTDMIQNTSNKPN